MEYQFPITAMLAALDIAHASPVFSKRLTYSVTDSQFVAADFLDPFCVNLMEIATDEKSHVSFLTSALGSAVVAECNFSFPSTTPGSFVALASVLEGVGVSAYLGAAASIIDKTYLTEASAVLTIEPQLDRYLDK